MSLVRADILSSRQVVGASSVLGISRHTTVLLLQVHVQSKRTLGLRYRKIVPSLLGAVGFPAGIDFVVGVSPVSLVRAHLMGDTQGVWLDEGSIKGIYYGWS